MHYFCLEFLKNSRLHPHPFVPYSKFLDPPLRALNKSVNK